MKQRTAFSSYFFMCVVLFLLATATAVAQQRAKQAGKSGAQKLSCQKKQSSFFPLCQVGDELYLEIPNKLLNRDFLLSSRVVEISSTANKTKQVAGQMFYNPALFRFSVEGNQVMLLKPDASTLCEPNDPLYPAFVRNNIVPIQQVFDVEEKTDTSTIINITKLILEDLPFVEPFGLAKPGKPIAKATKLLGVKAYPNNLEFVVRNAFETSKEPFTVVLQKAISLLPEKPMMGRLFDERMNYYDEGKKHYSYYNQSFEKFGYIKRFNLQPKGGKMPKKGQLVEPEKPIVFYIDDAFPPAWKEGIRKGIEDWQPAFEAIGFKNAIQAKDYPKNDPNFDPNSMRYNCVKLATSEFANAMGQHFVDPRSGEIVHAEVLFYSNVTSKLHTWYFLQTAAVNPDARKKVYDEKTMQALIRYLAAHEIGHCLGMLHNFRGSFAYNTEDLRNAEFTKQYGTTASIMDYARFNYVAQPGDKGVSLLPPPIGVYDYHAVRMAYQPIPEAKTPFDELPTLNRWLSENETNPMYLHGRRSGGATGIATDPACQSSDLGNNPVASSAYGISNLKYILSHLTEWMLEPGDSYRYTTELYADILKESYSYLEKVLPQAAGAYEFNTVFGSKLPSYKPVDKAESLKAIDFICDQLLSQHEWLNSEYVRSFAGNQAENIIKEQQRLVEAFFDPLRSQAIRQLYTYSEEQNFITASEYLRRLTDKLMAPEGATIYHRNMQQSYVQTLVKLVKTYTAGDKVNFYDAMFIPTVKQELEHIKQLLQSKNSGWSKLLTEIINS